MIFVDERVIKMLIKTFLYAIKGNKKLE